MSDGPIRVLIVDDSALVRAALSDLIAQEDDIDVMATAGDPYAAVERIRREVPDVIVLDIEMPRMDGLSFLRRLMAQRPIPVIICSTLVADGGRVMMEALRAGAVDVIGKPQIGTRAFFEESRIRISDKIRAAASARLDRAGARAPQSAGVNRPETARASRQELRAHRATGAPATVRTATPARETRRAGPSPRLIAIGASTGGTEALCRIMERIPATAPPVAIVQHMPEGFTEAFARRLDSLSPMQVFEARDGVRLGPGQAVVAPGNRHLAITGGASFVACRLEDGDLVNRHRPAVDVLFHSVARLLKGDAIGVILTGMGDDGTRGLSAMREAGAHTIGQDEATSVVYGMPKAARLAGAVVQEAPLDRIASAILARVAT